MVNQRDLTKRFLAARKQGTRRLTAVVGKGDGVTVDASDVSGENYTVWGIVTGEAEPTILYFTPGQIPYGHLPYGADVDLEKLNNRLVIKRLAFELRDTLAGATLPVNLADLIHTHENDANAGQLNASNVFSAGVVDEQYGGTGNSAYVIGDLLYASAPDTLSRLADVATGNALISGGVGAAPSWGKVGLTTHVSGTLAVGNGGTGAATLAANNVILGNGTDAVQLVAPGTSGNVLTSNGTTWISAAAASPWTTTSNVIHPNVLTDAVAVGTNTNNGAKLYVLGDDTTENTLRIRGASGQTAPLLLIENNTAGEVLSIDTASGIIVNANLNSAYDFKVWSQSGTFMFIADVSVPRIIMQGALLYNTSLLDEDFNFAGDNDANLLFGDAGNDRIGIGTNAPSEKLHVAGNILTTGSIEIDGALNHDGSTIGFFGTTPAAQQAQTVDLKDILVTYGLYASGAGATPLNLDNGVLTAGAVVIGTSGTSSTDDRLYKAASDGRLNWNRAASTSGAVELIGARQSKTSTTTISATSGASVTSPGVTVFSPNIFGSEWAAGSYFRLHVAGFAQGDSASERINITLTWGSGGTLILDVRTTQFSVASADRSFEWTIHGRIVTTGASGSVFVQPVFNSQLASCTNASTAATTVNTTIDDVLVVGMYFTTTSTHSMTITHASLEIW